MPLEVIKFPDFLYMWLSLNTSEVMWLHFIMETTIFYLSKPFIFSHFNFSEIEMQ